MDDARDGGLLGWMNVRLPGIGGVLAMSRTSFLGCEWPHASRCLPDAGPLHAALRALSAISMRRCRCWPHACLCRPCDALPMCTAHARPPRPRTGISIVDAASMALFSVACLVLFRWAARFVHDIDDATVEVADFSVIVKGLPETTPIDVSALTYSQLPWHGSVTLAVLCQSKHACLLSSMHGFAYALLRNASCRARALPRLRAPQIGTHFSRFGKVMDVVLVKDFGPLLHLASTATALERQRNEAEARLERGGNAGERRAWTRAFDAADGADACRAVDGADACKLRASTELSQQADGPRARMSAARCCLPCSRVPAAGRGDGAAHGQVPAADQQAAGLVRLPAQGRVCHLQPPGRPRRLPGGLPIK